MRIDVVSIFPAYLEPLRLSLPGKAVASGLVELGVHDLRQWTDDRHRTVDDTPYGGGAGMVMRPEPWGRALDALATPDTVLLMMTPSGRRFDQALADELAGEGHLLIACGRYEGFDARIAAHARTRGRVLEVSLGDYVLNGGEVAALAVVEAVVRLLPGVVGNPASLTEESHAAGHERLLEYPGFTKPPRWRGLDVPEVLFSGHHANIAAWRREQAVALTRERRPDLLPDELVLADAAATDAGELLTAQRGANVAEGRDNGSFAIPALTETLDELRRLIGSTTVLTARLDGRLVGSVRGERVAPDGWQIGKLFTVPDRQGQGIGSRLLAAVESRAPVGTRTYRLVTGAGSAANLRFYARRGYTEVRHETVGDGLDVVVLEKPAAGPGAGPLSPARAGAAAAGSR